jgi:hypothetical protein
MLVTLAVGVFAAGDPLHAQSGPGGGGGVPGGGGGGGGGVVPFGDVVGTWIVVGDLAFPTVATFTPANGQFSNGTFTWKVTNTLTGQVTTVQGTYTFGPVPEGGLGGLTMISQGEIIFRGLYAQPGPGEFIIETFAPWHLVGAPNSLLVFPAVAAVLPPSRSATGHSSQSSSGRVGSSELLAPGGTDTTTCQRHPPRPNHRSALSGFPSK